MPASVLYLFNLSPQFLRTVVGESLEYFFGTKDDRERAMTLSCSTIVNQTYPCTITKADLLAYWRRLGALQSSREVDTSTRHADVLNCLSPDFCMRSFLSFFLSDKQHPDVASSMAWYRLVLQSQPDLDVLQSKAYTGKHWPCLDDSVPLSHDHRKSFLLDLRLRKLFAFRLPGLWCGGMRYLLQKCFGV